MIESSKLELVFRAIGIILLIASCVHVFRESKGDRRIGKPWLHVISCALILWPLSYLFWLFLWPGKLRQKLFGSEEERAQEWARQKLKEK